MSLVTFWFWFQSVYTNISRVLEVADKLSEAVHYESDRIEALAQAVSREWKSFDMNITQRSCLLARSVAYHKHSEEVRHIIKIPTCSPVKMFLSSRQSGKSNRQQRPKLQGPYPEYKSDKCGVSGRYFVVGCQMAGCRHILTGLNLS